MDIDEVQGLLDREGIPRKPFYRARYIKPAIEKFGFNPRVDDLWTFLRKGPVAGFMLGQVYEDLGVTEYVFVDYAGLSESQPGKYRRGDLSPKDDTVAKFNLGITRIESLRALGVDTIPRRTRRRRWRYKKSHRFNNARRSMT